MKRLRVESVVPILCVAIVFSFLSPVRCGAVSLTAPVLDQIKGYLAFYKDDEWIQTQFRILTQISAAEDRKYEEARGILESFRPGLSPQDGATLESLIKRFGELSENEVFHLQEIVLYEIEKRKSFDPNFFHNMVARSARNAFRLERDAQRSRAAAGAAAQGQPSVSRFDSVFGPLKEKLWGLRVDKITGDPSLVTPERLSALRGAPANAALSSRIRSESAPLLRVSDIGAFQSFYEVILALYADDSIKKHGFFDLYEFMQYLLFLEVGTDRPNQKYKDGPLNISKLTEELTRPRPEQPITLVTDVFFESAAPIVNPEGDPLAYLATHLKQAPDPARSPRAWALYRYLRSGPPVKGKAPDVSQEVYENRIFVLTAMSDQDFFERYRSVRNDKLFFEQARKLSVEEVKNELRAPYKLPGGDFELPRYVLLGYTATAFEAETSMQAILERIPQQVHIEFIRPLILAVYRKLGSAEKEAIAKQRVPEIAEHFGSPAGRVGDAAMFRTFYSLFGSEIQAGAAPLAQTAGISQLDAVKWLSILLCIESRGNMFAVSSTGALGPLQHTYYFYLKTPPPSIPFDPKKSAMKTGSEFGKYYVKYKARSPAEALDMAAVAYNYGPEALEGALRTANWRANVSDEARRYVESFHFYLGKLEAARSTEDVGEALAKTLK